MVRAGREIGKTTVLRFRRWSRKRYAAFVSVTHCVSIGQLAGRLADRLARKSAMDCVSDRVEASRDQVFVDPEEEREDEILLTAPCLMSLPLLQDPAYPAGLSKDYTYYLYTRGDSSRWGWVASLFLIR